jgi:hypothetical protein
MQLRPKSRREARKKKQNPYTDGYHAGHWECEHGLCTQFEGSVGVPAYKNKYKVMWSMGYVDGYEKMAEALRGKEIA